MHRQKGRFGALFLCLHRYISRSIPFPLEPPAPALLVRMRTALPPKTAYSQGSLFGPSNPMYTRGRSIPKRRSQVHRPLLPGRCPLVPSASGHHRWASSAPPSPRMSAAAVPAFRMGLAMRSLKAASTQAALVEAADASLIEKSACGWTSLRLPAPRRRRNPHADGGWPMCTEPARAMVALACAGSGFMPPTSRSLRNPHADGVGLCARNRPRRWLRPHADGSGWIRRQLAD